MLRIRTDLELFDWHVERAARQDGPEAIESYRSALDLVTGRPFTYPNAARRSFGWVDYEHHATTWEHRVTTVAKAFAELCLDLNRHDEAVDQLRQLLQAVPLSSGLVEALMRTYSDAGDRAAAEALYQEHTKALAHADLGEPDESVENLRLCLGGTDLTTQPDGVRAEVSALGRAEARRIHDHGDGGEGGHGNSAPGSRRG